MKNSPSYNYLIIVVIVTIILWPACLPTSYNRCQLSVFWGLHHGREEGGGGQGTMLLTGCLFTWGLCQYFIILSMYIHRNCWQSLATPSLSLPWNISISLSVKQCRTWVPRFTCVIYSPLQEISTQLSHLLAIGLQTHCTWIGETVVRIVCFICRFLPMPSKWQHCPLLFALEKTSLQDL